jgi:phosphatidylserine/phosphatidylglycerophosphate/cardiolipin synthase-like enzyme
MRNQVDTQQMPRTDLEQPIDFTPPRSVRGEVELIVDQQHLSRVAIDGILRAQVSIDIATADLKAMLVPTTPGARQAPSILDHLGRLASRGVEVRLLHAGVPSSAALEELRRLDAPNLVIRRCPRLHAKTVIVDSASVYLGSANLTGAGLGAKHADRRNIEWGVLSRTAELIEAVSEQFNALWEGVRCQTCKRHDICPVPLEEPDL